ncbi:MAG TPA: hypothetical protein VKP59_07065 [Candidatus Thermoplasmatota archaeon]|nr:hypothetical protein [Candidatus Thermoplasmatota archaeon]
MEYKDFLNQKMVNVTCDFCGREMECPEELLETSKKHMCSICFKNIDSFKDQDIGEVHVDMNNDEIDEIVAENIANELTKQAFSLMWSKEKNRLRKMSKKEMSKEVFAAGIYMGIQALFESVKKDEDIKALK